MAASVFSVCDNPLSDISSVPLPINLHPPGLIKILDSHNNDQSKKQGHPVSTHQDAPCQHFRNPILKVFDPLKLSPHGPSVIFFDFKTHSATFIKIFDFRRKGW
jgi:hypothetical protein